MSQPPAQSNLPPPPGGQPPPPGGQPPPPGGQPPPPGGQPPPPGGQPPPPGGGNETPPTATQHPRFWFKNKTQAEEDAFDLVHARQMPKPLGVTGSVAHLVKGALGSGVLSSHVAVKKIGPGVFVPITICIAVYMTYCLRILVLSAQVLYKRTGVPVMSYPDVGEAAMVLFPKPGVQRFAKVLRYSIDVCIGLDLFGSCCTYQIIIAKTIKQLVENVGVNVEQGLPPYYLHLRVYLAMVLVPCAAICLIRHLKWLAPFSIFANFLIALIIGVAVYYCFQINPSFSGLGRVGDFEDFFQFVGMTVFAMSCAGVVIPIENNMMEPNKYTRTLVTGMSIIVCAVLTSGFFGYAAYLENSTSPITLNFPMSTFPFILKGCMGLMVYITHALNFWPPFDLTFYYLKKLHKPENHLKMEYVYRAAICIVITLISIAIPSITGIMGFLGTFCLTNMAFIWPNTVEMLVIYERPGYGRFMWRLWKEIILIIIGLILFSAGTFVNVIELTS